MLGEVYVFLYKLQHRDLLLFIQYVSVDCFISGSLVFAFCNLLPGVLKQILALVQLDCVFYSPMNHWIMLLRINGIAGN